MRKLKERCGLMKSAFEMLGGTEKLHLIIETMESLAQNSETIKFYFKDFPEEIHHFTYL